MSGHRECLNKNGVIRFLTLKEQPDGNELWVMGGQNIASSGLATAGAVLSDRAQEPKRWEDVPPMVYNARERLKAMDANGVDCSVLVSNCRRPGG